MGDKKTGKECYRQFNDTYVPDIIRLAGDDGKPELNEIKNYSPFISTAAAAPSATAFTGHERGFGNTEEPLKWRVLGTRQSGVAADRTYDHATGAGFVPAHRGDYFDAIHNKKATVKLLCHETLPRRHVSLRGPPPAPPRPRRDARRSGRHRLLPQRHRPLLRALLRAAHLDEHRDAQRAGHPRRAHPPPRCSAPCRRWRHVSSRGQGRAWRPIPFLLSRRVPAA